MLFSPSEKGQSLVEFALMLILIAMVVLVVLRTIGEIVFGMFNQSSNAL